MNIQHGVNVGHVHPHVSKKHVQIECQYQAFVQSTNTAIAAYLQILNTVPAPSLSEQPQQGSTCSWSAGTHQVSDTHDDIQSKGAMYCCNIVVEIPAVNDWHNACEAQPSKQAGPEHPVVFGLKGVVQRHEHSAHPYSGNAVYE